jgi:WD40 repeat protein
MDAMRVPATLGFLLVAGCACSQLQSALAAQPDRPAPMRILRLSNQDAIRPPEVTFSPDGRTLASGGADNIIRLWNLGTGSVVRQILAHHAAAGISRLSFTPDGKSLASASWAGEGTVKLWEVATGKERQRIGRIKGGITFLAVSPDGRTVAWGSGGPIRLHDLAAGRDVRLFDPPGAVDSVAFSPDGTILASANGNWTVTLWETATGKAIRTLRAQQNITTGSQAVAFSNDGKVLATAGLGGSSLWDIATGKHLGSLIDARRTDFSVGFAPAGRLVASGDLCNVVLWDAATRRVLRRWQGCALPAAFSPDSKRLAFFADPGGIALVSLDVPRGPRQVRPPKVRRPPLAVRKLSPAAWEQRWVSLAGADSALAYRAVWDLCADREQTLRRFPEWLRPVPPLNPGERTRVAHCLADLDNARFPARERASAELARLADRAAAELEKVLAAGPSPEARRRVERLLGTVAQREPTGESLRAFRAVEVLEHLATPEACALLQRLAGGAAGARLTREAKESLRRLDASGIADAEGPGQG